MPHLRIEVFVPFEADDELGKHIESMAALKPTYTREKAVASTNFIQKAFLAEAPAVASSAKGRRCSLRRRLTVKFKNH